MTAFLQLNNVSFTYPAAAAGRPTLDRINLTIEQGEFVALIGANGSGKSTLAKLLNVLLVPDSGTVTAAGLDTRHPANRSPIRSRVGMVFQKPQDQIVAMTVEEDVAFGPSNLGLPHADVRMRVEDALESTGLASLRERPPYQLSAGEAQRLALAGVLAMRPQCVIFDETTAMLDPAGRAMLMQQARSLHQQGITILMITHIMDEAAQADRVIVLHEGRMAMDGPPAPIFSHAADLHELSLDQPDALKTAQRLGRYFPSISSLLTPADLLDALPQYTGSVDHPLPGSPPAAAAAEPIIDIRGLSHIYLQGSPQAHTALEDLSIQVQPGSLHGLIGATGSGKSTLLQHINGLLRPQSGTVRTAGFDLNDHDVDLRALRRRAAMAFQQPEDQIFEQFVGDEIAYGPRMLGYSGKLADVVREAMHSAGLEFEAYRDRLTSTLSGGEKRRVALASVLAVQPDILLLDEPLAGLDPQAAADVIQLLNRLHRDGCTLLLSTHQYDGLLETLEHVSVLHQGTDVVHGTAGEVFSSIQNLEDAGLKAPLTARAASTLRHRGWPIPPHTASLAELEFALDALEGRGKP